MTLPSPTIADVANYSYIAHAPEGNVSLEPYANVRSWLARVEALPGFVPMPRTAAGLQATV
jgi:glutathione S-transferase